MASVKRSRILATVGRRSMLLSAVAVVMLAMLMAVPSRADDVTFFDTADTITASTTGSRIKVTQCGFTGPDPFGLMVMMESCRVTVSAPSGSVFSSGIGLSIAEADGTISDWIVGYFGPTSVPFQFQSDLSETGISCNQISPGVCPTLTEDGTVQFAGSITSRDVTTGAVTTTDNVFFQSGVDAPVPEPASLVLLGGGFLAIAGYVRRRLA